MMVLRGDHPRRGAAEVASACSRQRRPAAGRRRKLEESQEQISSHFWSIQI